MPCPPPPSPRHYRHRRVASAQARNRQWAGEGTGEGVAARPQRPFLPCDVPPGEPFPIEGHRRGKARQKNRPIIASHAPEPTAVQGCLAIERILRSMHILECKVGLGDLQASRRDLCRAEGGPMAAGGRYDSWSVGPSPGEASDGTWRTVNRAWPGGGLEAADCGTDAAVPWPPRTGQRT